MTLNKLRTVFFITFIITMIIGLLAYSAWGNKLPVKEVRDFVETSDRAPWIFISLYAVMSVFLPTTPMMAVGGILFGFWYGFLYTTLAGFVSSIFTFSIARILGKSFVEGVLGNRQSTELLDKYNNKMAHHGTLTVIVLRITPIMPFNILNLLMGVSRVNFKDYVAGTVVGLIPSNVLTVYFGSLLLTLEFRKISFFLAMALVLGLIAFAYFRLMIVWSYFKKKSEQE